MLGEKEQSNLSRAHRHCGGAGPHPRELEGLSRAEIALSGSGNKSEKLGVCKNLRCTFRTLRATVVQDELIIQEAVKANAHLLREEANSLVKTKGARERPKGRAGSWNPISPNETQPLPVSAEDQNEEENFFEVDGCGPVTCLIVALMDRRVSILNPTRFKKRLNTGRHPPEALDNTKMRLCEQGEYFVGQRFLGERSPRMRRVRERKKQSRCPPHPPPGSLNPDYYP